MISDNKCQVGEKIKNVTFDETRDLVDCHS